MRTRTLTIAAAGLALATAMTGLSACSSSTDSTGASTTPAASVGASAANGKQDPTALCKQIVDQKLTLDAANALAATNGNVTRVIKKDGADLPATADFIDNRLNFTTESDVVTACTVG
jgi:hypothetical protein